MVATNLLFSLLLPFIFATKVLADSNEDELQPCIDLLIAENAEGCCESLKMLKSWNETMDLCTKRENEDLEVRNLNDVKSLQVFYFTCDDYSCMFDKLGLMINSKIDEASAKRHFSSMAGEYPDQVRLIDYLGVTCFDGKYEHYDFMEENCPAINFFICSYTNILLECDSWIKSAECNSMADHAKACKLALNNPK